jgi:ribonuclease BN (tRNA processing enzyme)
MKLTVIGCWGGSPRPGGACSGYLLESAGKRLLVDCGSGVASAVQQACPLEAIDDVVVSHFHYDHMSDAGILSYARLVRRILGETSKDLVMYGLARGSDGAGVADLAMEGATRAVAVDEGDDVRIGPFRLSFLRTRHPLSCLAMRIACDDGSALGYTADSAYFEGLARFMEGVDVLLAECSLYAGVDGSQMGHMSSDDVVRLALCAHPGKVVLTHLPIYGDVGELLSCVRAGLHGTGMRVELAADGARRFSRTAPAAEESEGAVTSESDGASAVGLMSIEVGGSSAQAQAAG